MKKAVIFGVGYNYHSNKKTLHELFDVVALIDNNPKTMGGGGIKTVDYIKDIDYDLVIITPTEYEEMYEQLISFGVEKDKVLLLFLIPEITCNTILGYHYWGQHGEDLIIANIFARIGINYPSYMDLGANLPIQCSNTYFLYQNGCRGINIDANPETIKLFNMIRPKDVNLNVGIAAKNGEKDYFVFDKLSGLNTFSQTQAENFGVPVKKKVKLNVITLKDIVDKYCQNGFTDFLDCDIEGLDYDVLQSYDLKGNGPKVILVEVSGGDITKFDEMLDKQSYFKFCRIGVNNIYIKKEYGKAVAYTQF